MRRFLVVEGVPMTKVCALLFFVWLVSPVHAQPVPAEPPGSITGRVVRPDGLPQPDADVVTARRGRDGVLRILPWRAKTAFDGRYDITGVPAGRYLVMVRVVGGDAPIPGRPLATLFPGVAASDPGTQVQVFAGVPVEGVDIWLQPAPRRFQLEGRVLDSKGRPLDNVAIEYGRPQAKADSVWTVSDPGGLFTLDGVTPGPVVLRARADTPDGPVVGVASAELAVESAQDVRIFVREPGRVRGEIVATSGALPSGLRVSLVPTLLRPSALYPADEAAPDGAGTFTLAGGVGEHEVEVRGLPQGWAVRRVIVDGAVAPRGRIWLAAGDAARDIRVEVGAGTTRRLASR